MGQRVCVESEEADAPRSCATGSNFARAVPCHIVDPESCCVAGAVYTIVLYNNERMAQTLLDLFNWLRGGSITLRDVLESVTRAFDMDTVSTVFTTAYKRPGKLELS